MIGLMLVEGIVVEVARRSDGGGVGLWNGEVGVVAVGA